MPSSVQIIISILKLGVPTHTHACRHTIYILYIWYTSYVYSDKYKCQFFRVLILIIYIYIYDTFVKWQVIKGGEPLNFGPKNYRERPCVWIYICNILVLKGRLQGLCPTSFLLRDLLYSILFYEYVFLIIWWMLC
jgi:hypothetical protein